MKLHKKAFYMYVCKLVEIETQKTNMFYNFFFFSNI